MAFSREVVEQDYVIEQVRQLFQCTVLWCEGRACLEYDRKEELDKISDYIRVNYDKDLLDVFFTTIESLPQDD